MTNKELSQAAKEYLSELPKAERLICRLQSTADGLRASLTGQNYELGERVRHSGDQSRMDETFAQIIQLETDIQAEAAKLNAWRREALARIGRVNDLDQRNVLIARYIQNRRWESLATELNFSVRHVHRIHGIALLAFAEKNPDI